VVVEGHHRLLANDISTPINLPLLDSQVLKAKEGGKEDHLKVLVILKGMHLLLCRNSLRRMARRMFQSASIGVKGHVSVDLNARGGILRNVLITLQVNVLDHLHAIVRITQSARQIQLRRNL